jgi:glucan-binding YG repeat protein
MYFGADGAMRQEEWIGNYWVDFYGKMATNRWVDNGKYYVGADGAWIPGYGKPQWKKDAYGWWYDNGDGTYPKGDFKTIGGETYYFDWNGYMLTGWQYILKEWHFFKPSGAMKRNEWEGDYWLDASGFMARGCWVDGGKYYVGNDGKWVPGAKH